MTAQLLKAILQDAGIKEAYKAKTKGLQSAYNLALADFFNMPVIHEVDVSGLSSLPGSSISAIVTDDFRVEAVTVRIEKPDGSLLEEGNAQPDVVTATTCPAIPSHKFKHCKNG